jgi:hypothetical protein
MSDFDAEAVLNGLKSFQRDAVEHVIDRFYRHSNPGDRFLIADETGLGKSVVARGVIARVIEHLQTEDAVDRIDIVYICSNADLAAQNLRRLNVTGTKAVGITSRLTLLAKSSAKLGDAPMVAGKRVNLVSFTPGTSFNTAGFRTGSAEERAMLHLLLETIAPGDEADTQAARLLFRATVHTDAAFVRRIADLRSALPTGVDPLIRSRFDESIRIASLSKPPALDRFIDLRMQLRGLDELPRDWDRHATAELTADLRTALAKASVDTLEPDLIILDEFQRFRDLLDPERGGEAAELADSLFSYRTPDGPPAKVLLLSATPYKPFTTAESDGAETHYEDFIATIEFLSRRNRRAMNGIRRALGDYREALRAGADGEPEARTIRRALLPYMTRAERPQLTEGKDLHVRWLPSATPAPDDLVEYARMQRLADRIDTPIPLDYWKSVPHFASFMEDYKPGRRTRELIRKPSVSSALQALRGLDVGAIQRYQPIDLGNEHLRALAAETIGRGWWKLLWMPPSLPYLKPGSVYGSLREGDVTKRVIFSAWASVPTAIASLLSYEAERMMVGDATFGNESELRNTAQARTAVSARLNYVVRGRQLSMANLALFWPHPALAAACDPLVAACNGARTATAARSWAADSVRGPLSSTPERARNAWTAFFATPGSVPADLDAASIGAGLLARSAVSDDDEDLGRAIPEHVSAALALDSETTRWHQDLPLLAMHSPANCAWRALGRLRSSDDSTTDVAHWLAAARLANALRTLFNRMESMFALDQLIGTSKRYWRAVLDYCADGNLQAVLDEYAFQLRSEESSTELTDEMLDHISRRASEALTLRPTRSTARDTSAELAAIQFTARFALRYGGAMENEESVRQPEVRNAFNSPFAPFVLASTSVGQEGIDFHWWSHSVVHWNLPSNPVDFEQREGRVNRFAGHAVRKNLAAELGEAVLNDGGQNVWAEMFARAAGAHPELGEFAPWWIYPGPARIERVLVAFPLSRDRARYDMLRTDLTLYRLTLGQPRQQDMVEVLRKHGADGERVKAIDLRPPRTR